MREVASSFVFHSMTTRELSTIVTSMAETTGGTSSIRLGVKTTSTQ
jgi:hypothetical protein